MNRVALIILGHARSGRVRQVVFSVFLALWEFVLRVIYDHHKVKEGGDDQEEQNQSC
jgi:hypothetical protein